MDPDKLTFSSNIDLLSAGSEKRRYHARFVRSGPILQADGSPTQISVSAEALSRAVEHGYFDRLAVFVDHAGYFNNPSLRNIAGSTNNTIFTGDSVEGDIELYATTTGVEVAKLLDEILDQGTDAPNVGLSIVFYPIWQHDQDTDTHTVIDIKAVESVDLVFQPAADGRILAALSADQASSISQSLNPVGQVSIPAETQVSIPAETQVSIPATTTEEENQPMPEEIQTPTPTPPAQSVVPNAGYGEEWFSSLRAATTQTMIAASGLPPVSQQRLTAVLDATPNVSPLDVTDAIEAERVYLAAVQENLT